MNITLPNPPDEYELCSRFLSRHFAARPAPLRFLEAGCGKSWNLKPAGLKFHLTGIDFSKEALDIRRTQIKDLDEGIVGDLRTVPVPPDSFDLIYCSYVLEHIDGAQQVLDHFVRWLRPGGVAILLIPDRDSFFGWATRFTPFWFHVFYYRVIRGKPNAGKPGHGPFPTYYDRVVSRRGIRRYCEENGLEVRLEFVPAVPMRKIFGPAAPVLGRIVKAMDWISRGRIGKHNNLLYILEKPAAP